MVVLEAIREQVQSPKRIAEVRKTIAERLLDYSKGMDAELKDHRDRLKRTEERITRLSASPRMVTDPAMVGPAPRAVWQRCQSNSDPGRHTAAGTGSASI